MIEVDRIVTGWEREAFDEACTETDFNIIEMMGWLEDLRKNPNVPSQFVGVRFLSLFEEAVEEAVIYLNENNDTSCVLCGGSGGLHEPGMNCIRCGGSGVENDGGAG